MAIPALLLGRGGSVTMPNKNLYPLLGRPMMAYPILAARGCKFVSEVFVSTDSPEIMAVGRRHGARVIVRPPELCTATALGEDAFAHGYRHIRELWRREGKEIELIVLLFANSPTVTSRLIEEGVKTLRRNAALDSAVSVSCYNMWSPLRARRADADGCLQPFVPFDTFGDPSKMSCDRDSQGNVYYADMGVSVVRPGCLENLHEGLLPQRWMGKKIFPIHNWGGLDVDYEWQIPQAEFWLKRHGYTDAVESATPGKQIG